MASGGWVTVPWQNNESPQPYSMEGHSWKTLGTLPWEVCKHCGLIALHNDITQWCITKGCNHTNCPQGKKEQGGVY